MTDRRSFLAGTLALPFLARPWRPSQGTARVLLLAGDGASARDAVRGARLAADEAARTAQLLGTSFELQVLEVGGEVDAAVAGSPIGVVVAATDPSARRAGTFDTRTLPVIETLPRRPDQPATCDGAFSTAPSLVEAVRALARAQEQRDGTWGLVAGDVGVREAWTPRLMRVLEEEGIELRAAAGSLGEARAGGARHVLVLESDATPEFPGSPPVHMALPDDTSLRVATWHSSLFRYGAEQLNERYRRAWDAGMSSAAWCAWFAVKALAEAALRRAEGAAAIRDVLVTGHLRLDGHKGRSLAFRSTDLSLRQPLYIVHAGSGDIREIAMDDVRAGAACPPASAPS